MAVFHAINGHVAHEPVIARSQLTSMFPRRRRLALRWASLGVLLAASPAFHLDAVAQAERQRPGIQAQVPAQEQPHGSGQMRPSEQWFTPNFQRPSPEIQRALSLVAGVALPVNEIGEVAMVDLNGDGQAEIAFAWNIPANSEACRQPRPCRVHAIAGFTRQGGWTIWVHRIAGAMDIQRVPVGQWAKVRFRQTSLTEADIGIPAEIWVPSRDGTYIPSMETIPARVTSSLVPRDSEQGREILSALNAGLGRENLTILDEVNRSSSFRVAQWRIAPETAQRASSRQTPSAQSEELATMQVISGSVCGSSGLCPVIVLHRNLQPRSAWRVIGVVFATEGMGEPYLPNVLDGRLFVLNEPRTIVLYGLDSERRLQRRAMSHDELPRRS